MHRLRPFTLPFLVTLLSWSVAGAATTPGSLDATFGAQGVALSSVGDQGAVAMVLQADGKILTATIGDAATDRASLRITRFTNGGVVDSTFGSAGVATVSVAVDTLSVVHAMLRQNSDSRIVVAGRSIGAFALLRLTSAGAIDAGFGSGGTASTKVSGDDEVFALAQQTDGKLIAVGSADDGLDSDFAIVRYTSAGVPDPTFSGDGIATVEFGGSDTARAVAVQGDGSIVVAGSTEGSNSDIAVARLTPTGAPDPIFGVAGKATTAVTAREDAAYAVIVQTDGKIVVAGEADDDFVLLRYGDNGQPDAGFGSGGIARTNVSAGARDGARALVRQSDDKLVAGGLASPTRAGDFALVRYTTTGQPDSSFGSGGIVTTSVAATFDEEMTALLLQIDGKLLAAGLSEDGNTSYQMVARYLTTTAALCGDADQNGSIQAGDALRVLRNAVGVSVTCPLFVCDVDNSGGVQAGDALKVLKKAVGQQLTLVCPLP